MDTNHDNVIDFAEFCDGWEAFTSSSGGGGGSAHQPAFTKADAVAVGHFVHEAKVMYKQADEVENERTCRRRKHRRRRREKPS